MFKKKIVIAVMAGLMACSLCACGSKDEGTTAAGATTTATTAAGETTAATTAAATEAGATTAAATEAGPAEPDAPDPTTQSSSGDGQNPIMNFIGTYVNGRASITVTASGEKGATFSVRWSSSASTHGEWTMSGDFDGMDGVPYYNGVYKEIELDADGNVVKDETVYENGTGRMVFMQLDTGETVLRWDDDVDNMGSGMVFEYSN